MTEIELASQQNPLTVQMDYARAVSSAALLPPAYRGKPADIMLAMGLGQSMGLSPAESLYRIDVIQGKPTASAELIASNVRKAGHRLRMKVTEDPPSATCTIIRSDDPDEPISITRDVEWAKKMGLLGKDNYKQQPATMLAWRAITACARLACSEALYGVNYTADELGDMGDHGVEQRPTGGLEAALKNSGPEASQATAASDSVALAGDVASPGPESPVDAEVVEEMLTDGQRRNIGRLMGEKDGLGITDRDEALGYVSSKIGRTIGSRNELTRPEAVTLINALEADLALVNGGDES